MASWFSFRERERVEAGFGGLPRKEINKNLKLRELRKYLVFFVASGEPF